MGNTQCPQRQLLIGECLVDFPVLMLVELAEGDSRQLCILCHNIGNGSACLHDSGLALVGTPHHIIYKTVIDELDAPLNATSRVVRC